MEDHDIVELYLRREERAIEETAARYGRRLNALAYGIVAERESAEECENDTYWAAWRSIPPHTPRDYLYAFLARITRHLALSRCRERERLKRKAFLCELSEEMEQCLPAPDDCACRLEEEELKAAINGFLAGLEAEKRNLFLRRYWYLDSVEALSQRFGWSESKVKTTLFRCRARLRKYLEQEGYTL